MPPGWYDKTMTSIRNAHGVVVRGDEAEKLALPNNETTLLAEGADTGGAFSAIRAKLAPGADGARPHHHSTASELFFVIEGTVDILLGEEVVTARAGDLAVAAPGAMHAFANASASAPLDLLIIFGPGIERFDYFRLLQDVVAGKKPFSEVLATQERFDNWFSESAVWTAHRSGKPNA
jgi:mannose-6-phosphate isomerase-like protein (cupin superfamily)